MEAQGERRGTVFPRASFPGIVDPAPGSAVRAAIRFALDEAAEARRALARAPSRRAPLHRYRESLRRLEAALALGQGTVPRKLHENAVRATRRARKGLGRYRDADVLARRLAPIAQESPEVEPLLAALEARRRRGRKTAVRESARRSRRRVLHRCVRAAARSIRGDAVVDALAFPAARVRLRYLRLGSPDPNARELHELRLALKELRYAAEALARVRPAGGLLAAVAVEAKEATDLLGDVSDAEGFCAGIESLVAGDKRQDRDALAAAVEPARVALLRDAEESRREFLEGWEAYRWPRLLAFIGFGAAALHGAGSSERAVSPSARAS